MSYANKAKLGFNLPFDYSVSGTFKGPFLFDPFQKPNYLPLLSMPPPNFASVAPPPLPYLNADTDGWFTIKKGKALPSTYKVPLLSTPSFSNGTDKKVPLLSTPLLSTPLLNTPSFNIGTKKSIT